MRGVPKQHTDWLCRRFANRTARLSFGDFVSVTFRIYGGLDQGDPHSGFSYGMYNAQLAKIPRPTNGEHGVVFVDDNTLITVGRTFRITHEKLRDIIERPKGVNRFATTHNALFGPAKYQLLD
ncbi:hypothetical protein C8F04DRAFT_883323, partial [Mycena alexandri]